MTEREAITKLKRRAYRTTCYGNKVLEHEENLVAIEALEKQIAKKAKVEKYSFYPHSTLIKSRYGKCPNCGTVQVDDRYCANCGQKLYWSDT